eukprot:TRINITY_DN2103_c0_g2_i1.p1 TRINITY_DN2103_c0_g2~~TRINITY_DN2103_c0_g2_i1.p1  ORF type:complete len:173 (-),score=14.52 TRINITY_DN2103_c0_g2_i1:22-540(-)
MKEVGHELREIQAVSEHAISQLDAILLVLEDQSASDDTLKSILPLDKTTISEGTEDILVEQKDCKQVFKELFGCASTVADIMNAYELKQTPPSKTKLMRYPQEYTGQKRGRKEITSKRICSQCATMNTPGWRQGPLGACLCNACGLVYIKSKKRKGVMKISYILSTRKINML